jgi:hypothetical protein
MARQLAYVPPPRLLTSRVVDVIGSASVDCLCGRVCEQLAELDVASLSSYVPYKKVYGTDCQPWC